MAAVSFLAARASPSGGFWITLAGGVALARAGERFGARRGYGASVAAMLQSVAMIGPARFGVPLTQALTAPMLGRMNARGLGIAVQVLACAAIRTVQNALGVAFFVFIVTGLDAYAASYDELISSRVGLPAGTGAALALTVAGLLAWSAFGSTVQVLVYRRGLARWHAEGPPAAPEEPDPRAADGSPPPEPRPRRFDPRAVALAAATAFGLLLVSTSGPLIVAVGAWLLVATVIGARLERQVVPAGLALAAVLGLSGLAFSAIGGLGLDVAVRRGARAALLVLVATWLRAAAGSGGVREVARRALRRLRAVPSLADASRVFDELGATPRLAAAGRALFDALRPVRKRPLPVVDAVLGWVRAEAGRFRGETAAPALGLRVGPHDAALVVLSALPVLALLAT